MENLYGSSNIEAGLPGQQKRSGRAAISQLRNALKVGLTVAMAVNRRIHQGPARAISLLVAACGVGLLLAPFSSTASAAPYGWTVLSNNFSLRSAAGETRYVSAEYAFGGRDRGMLRARATAVGPWERFTLLYNPTTMTYALQSTDPATNTPVYVSAEFGYPGAQKGELRARATAIGPWEQFAIALNGTNSTIRSTYNQNYVSAELAYGGDWYGMLRARATDMGDWEQYTGAGMMTVDTGWTSYNNCQVRTQVIYFTSSNSLQMKTDVQNANAFANCTAVAHPTFDVSSYGSYPGGNVTDAPSQSVRACWAADWSGCGTQYGPWQTYQPASQLLDQLKIQGADLSKVVQDIQVQETVTVS